MSCCYCDCLCCDFILTIIAFFLPPLPVAIKKGLCSCDFIINILLCMLGYVPGLIHAWYIILKNPDYYPLADEENQIFIVRPPDGTPQVIITQQPDHNQTRIHFQHPEPFLESRLTAGHHHTAAPTGGQLSPLSCSPAVGQSVAPIHNFQHLQQQQQQSGIYSPSPLHQNYGAINLNDEDDNTNDDQPPPSYENVMNETAKQYSSR
ncbi:unnamed protein product [Ambrosiozyma monospora]|uniref:Unnamed protein product n=1 Tax=Ambrosiozyma monospora TaxID=43982 RepID=A0A9W7DD64_AMBMO|nr:unnamed protein product [Ambrosiozyma monospora]